MNRGDWFLIQAKGILLSAFILVGCESPPQGIFGEGGRIPQSSTEAAPGPAVNEFDPAQCEGVFLPESGVRMKVSSAPGGSLNDFISVNFFGEVELADPFLNDQGEVAEFVFPQVDTGNSTTANLIDADGFEILNNLGNPVNSSFGVIYEGVLRGPSEITQYYYLATTHDDNSRIEIFRDGQWEMIGEFDSGTPARMLCGSPTDVIAISSRQEQAFRVSFRNGGGAYHFRLWWRPLLGPLPLESVSESCGSTDDVFTDMINEGWEIVPANRIFQSQVIYPLLWEEACFDEGFGP